MSDDDDATRIGTTAWAKDVAASLRVAARIAEMDEAELAAFRGRLRADPEAREEISGDLADTTRMLGDLLAIVEVAERRLVEP